MKLWPWLSLFLIPAFVLGACVPASRTIIPTLTVTPAIPDTETPVPTQTVRLPTVTLAPTLTPTLLDTLAPEEITATLQPLLKEPINCAVPCFWGIIPGKTTLDEARNFFTRLGFTPFEGENFYTILYKSDSSRDSSVTLYTFNNFVEDIVLSPHITAQKEGSPRTWIAYSPETLIKRYGSPSRVEFAVDWGPSITINMIMYFDTSGLIVAYSGYNMTPEHFCPLTAPFNSVRLWMGYHPPDLPSFPTVPLEEATSLTMDQFTQLMTGDPSKACFTLDEKKFP